MKLTVLLVFLSTVSWASAQVRLPQLMGDKMVLQRDIPLKLWGWAAPSERIELKFAGHRYKTRAGADSSWEVRMPPMKAGGPYTLEIQATNHLVVNDILVGDVWFCSGQSNMVLPMERVKEKYPDDVAGAEFPMIRNFFIATAADVAATHTDYPPSKWIAATPQHVLAFGAASWFFAKS